MEREDYRKYLSVDNGNGILLNQNDAFILGQYGIDYCNCSNISDLILLISNYIDDNYDSELDGLEEVLEHLMEMHYYYEVKK